MKIFRQRLFWAFLVNLAIVAMEIVGVVLSVKRHGVKVFQFYTENSNYFTLIVSAIFCIGAIIAIKKKAQLPSWILVLRFISTVCLGLTLVVVLFVLIPMYPSTLVFMLFKDSNLYQHLLCPILSIISFLLLENQEKLSKSSIFYALIPTIVYGVVCITLNLLKLMTGPYPFFYVYEIAWYVAVLSILGVFVIATLITLTLFALFNKGERKSRYQALQNSL